MESLVALLPALGCLLMMPAMMWFMSRGRQVNDSSVPRDEVKDDEIRKLSDEVSRLRSEVDGTARPHERSGG